MSTKIPVCPECDSTLLRVSTETHLPGNSWRWTRRRCPLMTDTYEQLEEIHDLLTNLSTRVERHANLYVRIDHLEERVEELEAIMHAERN